MHKKSCEKFSVYKCILITLLLPSKMRREEEKGKERRDLLK